MRLSPNLLVVAGLLLALLPIARLDAQANEPEARRKRMVTSQIAARDIRDPRVLAAMERVPRHLFVPPEMRGQAYEDYPLPIGDDQTISQPYIVALMTSLLELRGLKNCHGIYNYSPTDHDGLSKKDMVFIRIEGGKFKRMKFPG